MTNIIRYLIMYIFIVFAIIYVMEGMTYAEEEIEFTNGVGRKVNPIASEDAVKGGILTVFSGSTPKSLNYYLANNVFSSEVFGLLYESLLGLDPITYEFGPNLAEEWAVSEDGLVFYFRIDKKAKWSDGIPITAADVKFTYDTLMDTMNMTGVWKVGLDRYESPEIIDTHTIRFTASENHWKNLDELSALLILPKHIMEGKDFNNGL